MITLTSDFGLKDSYVAEMKAVILSINPSATIVDVTHCVEKFDIREGAFMLASAAPYFPNSTVHLEVVDPGVGTQRRAIVIETKKSFFVGPDNGVLILAAQAQEILHVYEIENSRFKLPRVSSTFQGRDVFAPAAAYLDLGEKAALFGPEITDPIRPSFTTVEEKGNTIVGEIISIDSFGNIITNIRAENLPNIQIKTLEVKFPKTELTLPFLQTYAQLKPQQPLVLIGSHGFLEIALNRGSAGEKYHVVKGDRVIFSIAEQLRF